MRARFGRRAAMVFAIITTFVCVQVHAMEDLLELSIPTLQQHMAAGDLSAVQLTQFYLDRIRHFDATLHAFNAVNPAALDIARKLDDERHAGHVRGPLHGIPVLLKDNIDTADGMPNTAGSLLLADNRPATDAPLVNRLRAAGAVILGKANLSEWANFRSTRSSSGWSAVGGQAHNPYDITRSPCGSSAGSAVAVAANLATVAVGTETDGSVTCPSALNNLVGIKPTLGVISSDGIIPIAHSQDTAGPMARTVTDAVLLLEAMSGRSYAEHLRHDGLKGKRIGMVTNLMGNHDRTDIQFRSQMAVLESAGATIQACELKTRGKWRNEEYLVLLYEFRHDIEKYLASTNSKYRTLADLIKGNEAMAGQELRHFAQEIFLEANLKEDLGSGEYLAALADSKRLAGKEGIDSTLTACGVDLLVAPTATPAWKIDHVMGDNSKGGAASAPAVAGYPHLTVPMGFVADLPVGMSFIGGENQEGVLIEAAFAYEQATHHRRPPAL